MRYPGMLLTGYAVVTLLVFLLVGPRLAQEIFPSSASEQMRLRIDAPDGTRVAVTEDLVRQVLEVIHHDAGDNNLNLTLSYVGGQGSSYPINTVFLWTSGPQQAVVNVGLRPGSSIKLATLRDRLRKDLSQQFPTLRFSFDPGDLISQILNFGTPSLAEVAVSGPQYADVQNYAEKVRQRLIQLGSLRDVEVEEPLHYPTVDVQINRIVAGQLGTTADEVGAAVGASTASSRFVAPNYWRDPRSGVSYQVQVQVPQAQMTSIEDIANIPVSSSTNAHPLLSEVAQLRPTTVPGELDRINGLWTLEISANLAGNNLGLASREIKRAIHDAGDPPRGVSANMRGQVNALSEIFGELTIGLAAAIVVILLLLTANFQSFRLALIVVSTVPAVLCGVILMLFLTGTTLNLQSFMGAIMAIGVAVANAILLVTPLPRRRLHLSRQ